VLWYGGGNGEGFQVLTDSRTLAPRQVRGHVGTHALHRSPPATDPDPAGPARDPLTWEPNAPAG
jgi:hypothetical protein